MRLGISAQLIIVVVISVFSGCSATGPRFDLAKAEVVPPTGSQLYVFRESAFIESGTYPVVLLDGRETGDLRNGGYLVTQLDPGSHELLVQSGGMLRGQWIHGPPRLLLDAEPGKRHYVQVSLRTTGVSGNIMYRGASVFEVSESTALKSLSELSLSK